MDAPNGNAVADAIARPCSCGCTARPHFSCRTPVVTRRPWRPRRQRAAGLDRSNPLQTNLRDLGRWPYHQVRRSTDEPLFNQPAREHHYLGYQQPVGEHLKYPSSRPIAGPCVAWSSAPRHLGPRDRFIAGRRTRGGATSGASLTTRAF